MEGQSYFGVGRVSSRQIRPNLYIIPSGCRGHDYNVNHFYDIDININDLNHFNINDLNHFNNVDNIDDNINDNINDNDDYDA